MKSTLTHFVLNLFQYLTGCDGAKSQWRNIAEDNVQRAVGTGR